MFRALRRWWARLRHKHEWTVIHRSKTGLGRWINGKFRTTKSCPAVLERCTCGMERARHWDGFKWVHEDLDHYNDWLARQEIDIPARHQE